MFSTTRPGVEAYKKGSPSIADELVFPGKDGTPLASRRLLDTYFVPVLQHAGLRRFRSHDLRHTFGSLLIEEGAPHPYFRDQLGHSSIQITADKYVHLVARRNVHFIDRLDEQTSPQPNATPAQPQAKGGLEPPPLAGPDPKSGAPRIEFAIRALGNSKRWL